GERGRSFSLFLLTGVEGYELRSGANPGVTAESGRALSAADGGTTNVMVLQAVQRAPLNLKLGNDLEVTNRQNGSHVVLHVVGFYTQASRSSSGVRLNFFFQPILADRSVVDQLGSSGASTIVS